MRELKRTASDSRLPGPESHSGNFTLFYVEHGDSVVDTGLRGWEFEPPPVASCVLELEI